MPRRAVRAGHAGWAKWRSRLPATGSLAAGQPARGVRGLSRLRPGRSWRSALTVTDPAGYVTTTAYDALGQETSEWTPGNSATGPATDTWAYTVSRTAPSFVTEQIEEPGGGYLTTETLDDSFGQVREVQQETASGGTDVTDTTYDSDGWKALVSSPYYTSSAPSSTLIAAASTSVPSQTGNVYDGVGRVIKQISYALGTETWETDTTYDGNYTTVVPPAGGIAQTTFTDGRGLTTAIWQYHAAVPVSTSDPSGDYDQTSYTYTPAGKLATITDAAGNVWSYSFDLLGDQLTQTTPDAGTTTGTFDAAGQLMSTTDARGKQISYTYDADGQQTSYTESAAGGLPAETVSIGYNSAGEEDSLTGASSYVDSLSYTNLGQPLQYTMGTSSEPAYITDSYDPQTGNLAEQDTQTGTAQTSVDDLSYTYNDVGNVTSEADTPSGNSGATDVQCLA
jgi:YD repeat-containing protein